jgi:hypothetical protein
MKTIKVLKIIHKNKPFTIKVYKTNSLSNYSLFVSVFKFKNDMPLVGKTFKDNSTNEQIKDWAKHTLNWSEMQCYVND